MSTTRQSGPRDPVADEIRAERIDTMSGPDSPAGRELGAAIGANVRRSRDERGLDLDALATRSGIPRELLAALEAGEAVPSLRAVWSLATSLGVPFGALLAGTPLETHGDPDFRILGARAGREIASASGAFRSRALLSGEPRGPEVYELRLAAGCFEPAEPHAGGTWEHLVVTAGTLVVRSDEKEARLGAGDSLLFRADVPHSYENPAAEDTVAHLVMIYREPVR